jgi:hypothetical protein
VELREESYRKKLGWVRKRGQVASYRLEFVLGIRGAQAGKREGYRLEFGLGMRGAQAESLCY